MRIVLAVSLCVNLVLIAVWLAGSGRPTAPPETRPPSVPDADPQVRTDVVIRKQFFTWDQVESEDYPTYIDNLRAIGCPEQTVRDIIVADVENLFAQRLAEEGIPTGQQWWQSSPDPELERTARARQESLARERDALLTRLLGPDWASEPVSTNPVPVIPIPLEGPVLGALSESAKTAVQEINAEIQQQFAAALDRAASEGRSGVTRAELAHLHKQASEALAQILAPSQLEEFQVRYSMTARALRSQLASMEFFEISPEEFRRIVRVAQSYDLQLALLPETSDSRVARRRQDLESQRQEAIKNALGKRRYDQFRSLQDPAFREAASLAEAAGKAEATPVLFAVDQFTEAEMDRIRNNTNLSGLEQEVELARIELERLKATAQILGQPVQQDRPPSPPMPMRTHTLQAGDTIGALAQRYNVPVNVLLQANPVLLQPALLRPGMTITIPSTPPVN